MTINKYTGNTKEDAIAKAKAELGDGIVIMNTKNRKPDGLLGIFKSSIWEVTVAIEDDTDGSVSILKKDSFPTSTFQASADEDISLPPIAPITGIEQASRKRSYMDGYDNVPKTAASKQPASLGNPLPEDLAKIAENDLKDAFREISQVIESAEERSILSAPKSDSPIIKDSEITKAKTNPVTKRDSSKIQSEEATPAKAYHSPKRTEDNLPIVKMVYNKLIENEVDEKYINQIFDDMGNVLTSANSLDLMISNIYQKMVLKLGTPSPIELKGKGPTVVFFVGPTGVGKTTTIAKIASVFKLEYGKKVSFVTADTYRIAATEQLNVYAGILDAPISIVYDPSELNPAIEAFRDQDLVLVDTVGFSHRNEEQKNATKALVNALDGKYSSQTYLVMSVTTKYADLKEIADTYKDICDYNLIFTKLDETDRFGNILNIKLHTGAGLSYVTNGQNVPDDIEPIDSQKLVKAMLGG